MAGKANGRTKACGVGARFTRLSDAELWLAVGQDVTGGSWLIRRDGDTFLVLSPTEQKHERELVTTH